MRAKSIGILFFLTSFLSVNAQITNLQKLSNGKFYDSDVIRDENNNIKGYFLLFETDKIAKETVELEYIVLDENLTKVTNGLIVEMKFESLLAKADRIKIDVTFFNNKLLIEFRDNFKDDNNEYFRRYRIIDLKDNKLGEMFVYNKDKLNVNPVFDRKMKNFTENQTYKIIGLDKIGLVVDKSFDDKYSKEKSLICFDENFNQKWKTDYEIEKNNFGKKELSFLKSNDECIVFFNHYFKNGYYKPTVSVLLFDAKSGKLNTEYFFPDQSENSYKVVDCVLSDGKLVLLGNYSKKSDYGHISDEQNLGLFKITLDTKNGKVLNQKYLDWATVSSKLDINKNGYIKNEGNVFIHNMIKLTNDKLIVVCEAFKQSPITTNNMYFLELSPDFKLTQVLAVEKFRNKFPGTSAHSNDIKKYALFDFIDYQSLGDDEFLFFLSDNEKNTKNRNKSTLYGIVSYSEGTFKKQTLDLKTETSTIIIYPSKKGYITLIEDFDAVGKPTEMRLEKVNY
jgi:hypothetical protein